MKKIIFSVFAIAAILTSCNKNEPQVELKAEGATLYASIEDDATKTTYDEGSILWAAGDAILVLNVEGGIDPYILSGGNGTKNGVFTSTSTVKDAGMALYPANPNHGYDGTTLTVNLPESYGDIQTEYTPNTNVPMVGFAGENGLYSFSHLGAAMCVKVAAPVGTQEVSLTASGIAGNFYATMADGKIAKADDAADATVSWLFKPLTEAADLVFYFPVPTGKYQNLKIDVKDASATLFSKSMTFSAAKELKRKQIAMLPDVSYEPENNIVTLDFEDGSQSLMCWTSVEGGTCTGGICNTDAHGGNNSYMITPSLAGAGYNTQAAYDLSSNLDQNKTYKISFYVKSDAAAKISFVYQNAADYTHQAEFKTMDTGSDWALYEVKFTPAFDDINRLVFNVGTVATNYYIDDICLGEAQADPNIIVNGGFEDEITYGWNDFSWNAKMSYEQSESGYQGKCAVFTIGADCKNQWDVQLFQELNITPGKTYSYSFWAKSDSSIKIQFVGQGPAPDYAGIYAPNNWETTDEWTKYSGTLTYSGEPEGVCRLGFQFGKDDPDLSKPAAKLWLDEVVVTEN